MDEYEALTSAIGRQGPLREVLEADAQKLRHIAANWGLSHDLLTRFRKLHREHFSGYMGEKRKAMARKYQYDVKNAAHLIRLLRMGSEFIVSGILAQLMAASPTFAKNWDLTATHYPPSDPETLPAALYALSSHLQQLVVKDRHAELAPLLTALEVAYAHASPAQRERLRQCVIARLAWDCREMGLDPQLFLIHLGPRCRAVWAEAESDRV